MFDAIYSLLILGDYTGGMYAYFGIDEDAPVVHAVLAVRALFIR